MKGDHIEYQSGYKYQVRKKYIVQVGIFPDKDIITPFLKLRTNGNLEIELGYAWDGASGPTWDDKTNMRGSLVHDALYQLMREGVLPLTYRAKADDLLSEIMIEDGAWKIRASYYHLAVDRVGLTGATCEGERKINIAP
jgi:hypothetical protein